jgi:hypothetical protein
MTVAWLPGRDFRVSPDIRRLVSLNILCHAVYDRHTNEPTFVIIGISEALWAMRLHTCPGRRDVTSLTIIAQS